MPTMWILFEQEIHELSRAALRLEKLIVGSNSLPSPIQYQQILKRLSEFHRMWQDHRITRQKLISALSSVKREVALAIEDIDELGFSIEQQLNAVSTSAWPHSAQAGMCSLRLAAARILNLIFQHIARERATCAPFIHHRNTSLAGPLRLVLPEPVSRVKRDLRLVK